MSIRADDEQGGDGVGAREPTGDDHDAGDHRADEAVEIGEDVAVGALHVQRLPVGPRHHHRGDQVDRHPDGGDDDQDGPVDGRRVEEADDGLERHDAATTMSEIPLNAAARISARLRP